MCKGKLFVIYLAAWPYLVSAYAADQTGADAVTSKSTGSIEVSVLRHSPIYAEVDRSSVLSLRLIEALAAKGFTVTQDKADAKAVLTRWPTCQSRACNAAPRLQAHAW